MNIPLPRFLQEHQHHRQHADALATTLVDTTLVDTTLNLKDRIIICDPSDSLTLRGIPAIGRGVAGVIAGTQPEQRTCR